MSTLNNFWKGDSFSPFSFPSTRKRYFRAVSPAYRFRVNGRSGGFQIPWCHTSYGARPVRNATVVPLFQCSCVDWRKRLEYAREFYVNTVRDWYYSARHEKKSIFKYAYYIKKTVCNCFRNQTRPWIVSLARVSSESHNLQRVFCPGGSPL